MEAIFIKAQAAGEIKQDINPRGIAIQMITSFEGTILLGGLADTFSVQDLGHILFETIWTQIKA